MAGLGPWKVCECGGQIEELSEFDEGDKVTVKSFCAKCSVVLIDRYQIKYLGRETIRV